MNIWSRVVRVPHLVIEETNGYLKEDNNFYNNNNLKWSKSREWYTYHFKRSLKIFIFKVMVNMPMGLRNNGFMVWSGTCTTYC